MERSPSNLVSYEAFKAISAQRPERSSVIWEQRQRPLTGREIEHRRKMLAALSTRH